MDKKLISILMVNYNGKELLKIALNSIKKQNFNGRFEVIIVDNNSTDNSQEFLKKKYKDIKLIQNKENLGYCGINAGIRHCNGRYIFFTNNDIALDKNCIRKLAEALDSDKKMGIASPKVVNYFNKNLSSCGTWVSRSFYNGHFKFNKDFRKEIPYNGIALIRKEIVDKFRYLFDSDYFAYAEDLDLGLRTRLLGYRVVHIPKAILYHMHGVTMTKNRKYNLTYLMEKNLLSTFFKILSIKSIIILLPYVIVMRFIGALKDVLSFRFINSIARFLAIFAVIVNMPSIIKKRISIQKMRKVDDSFLFQVFSEKYLFSRHKINV